MTNRRLSCALAIVAMCAAASPGHTAGEAALIAAVPGTIKTDPDSLKQAAASGKASGWSVPTKSSGGLGLEGTWRFVTHRDEQGTATFKGGNVTYGAGEANGAFSGYSLMSNQSVPSAPVLVVLKAGGTQVWYMPFKKSRQMTLVNIANKSQWISLMK